MGIGIIINRGASQEPWNGLDAARRVLGNPGGSHINSVENIDQNTVDWMIWTFRARFPSKTQLKADTGQSAAARAIALWKDRRST